MVMSMAMAMAMAMAMGMGMGMGRVMIIDHGTSSGIFGDCCGEVPLSSEFALPHSSWPCSKGVD